MFNIGDIIFISTPGGTKIVGRIINIHANSPRPYKIICLNSYISSPNRFDVAVAWLLGKDMGTNEGVWVKHIKPAEPAHLKWAAQWLDPKKIVQLRKEFSDYL